MNVFEAVKGAVTTRQAAERYGITVNQNGMAVCPFHHDKNPSMKLDDRFHCFGCQADGDVIDFVSQLFQLTNKESAVKLASDFGIAYDSSNISKPKPNILAFPAKQEDQSKDHYLDVLTEYYRQLKIKAVQYAPQNMDAQWHPFFIEALQKKCHIEYLLKSFLCADLAKREELVAKYNQEVTDIERQLRSLPDSR